jgi:hypothetical protein
MSEGEPVSLSVDNVIHENSGTTVTGTSHVVSLVGGDSTTAGNTLVIAIYTLSGQVTPPAGVLLAKAQNVITQVFYKSDLAAGETSWTFTTVGSVATAWYVTELSNVDVLPVDATAGATSGALGNGGTASTGTTALNAGLSTVAFAVFGVNLTGCSWSGYTNGFEEVADVNSASTGTLGVARLFENSTTRTFQSTATLTTSGSGLSADAAMVVLRAADSPIVAPLAHLLGFDWGTHGGINSHSGITNMTSSPLTGAPSGTFGTNYLIQAGSARNSSYGLRIVQSGAAAYVRCGSISSSYSAVGFNVRVVSATGTVVVADMNSNGLAATAQLLYDSSATKFGVRCGTTGTVSWQSGTTALNTWVWIDLRVKTITSTWHAEWRIETGPDTYTDQTAADLAGQTASTLQATLLLGGNAAQTMTADYDDLVMSTYYVAYPLGPHEVRLLTVDPVGTPSVSGTTTNFSVFTANGTLAAWNAVNARNAVDEVPPTISASADGVTQTAAAASDYMEFPMADPTLGSTEYIAGVRMLAALGSGTGSGAGDFALRGWDGTTETALASVSQVTPGSPTAISATVPRWCCAMWPSINGWTLAELAAAAVRAGFSPDATPDMWMHAVYLEVAIGKTSTQQLLGDAAAAEVDPTRLGLMSTTVTTPAEGGATLRWTDTGGSGSQYVAPAGSYTKQFDPASQSDVSVVEVESDPEFTERE